MTGRRRGRGRPSARALAGAVAVLVRGYVGGGGPVLAVVLFLSGAGIWWALGSLVPWFALAGLLRRLSRGS